MDIYAQYANHYTQSEFSVDVEIRTVDNLSKITDPAIIEAGIN